MSHIQDIEKGRTLTPHEDTLQRLVAALNLSPSERDEIEAAISRARAQRHVHPAHALNPPQTEPPKVQDNQGIFVPRKVGWLNVRKMGIVAAGVLIAMTLFLLLRKDPGCPQPNMEGVTLYELPCYEGRSLTLRESDLDLCDNPLDPSHDKVNPCFSAPSWNDVASSMWVSPEYHVELHLHSPELADDSMLWFDCNTAIRDFGKLRFPNGDSVDNNVSRVIIRKSDCN
jgi:hypothetical protein